MLKYFFAGKGKRFREKVTKSKAAHTMRADFPSRKYRKYLAMPTIPTRNLPLSYLLSRNLNFLIWPAINDDDDDDDKGHKFRENCQNTDIHMGVARNFQRGGSHGVKTRFLTRFSCRFYHLLQRLHLRTPSPGYAPDSLRSLGVSSEATNLIKLSLLKLRTTTFNVFGTEGFRLHKEIC